MKICSVLTRVERRARVLCVSGIRLAWTEAERRPMKQETLAVTVHTMINHSAD